MRGARFASLGLIVALACGPSRPIVGLPPLEGMSTLLVRRGVEVLAFDLRIDPHPTIKWTPDGANDALLLGAYRGTFESLALQVADGRVVLDPDGVELPPPSAAYAVDTEAALAPVLAERFAERPRIAGHACTRLKYTAAPALPLTDADGAIAAPNGAQVIEVVSGSVYLVSLDESRTLGQSKIAPFPARGGGVWIVERRAITRLDARLARVETLSTAVLTSSITRAAEAIADVSPRFFLFGRDERYYGWDGVGPPVDLRFPRMGREPQLARLLPRADGTLWVAEGGLFGERSVSGEWTVTELAQEEGSFSNLIETASYGPIYVVRTRFPNNDLLTRTFARKDGAWVPFLPDNFIDSRVMVDHRGRLLGRFDRDLVDVSPGADERPPARCVLTPLAPPPNLLVSTSIGVFATGTALMGTSVYAAWLTEP